MKTINYRKMAMTLGGIVLATLAVGCYGGGSGYSSGSYGYHSSYRSYGSSAPYRSGYSAPSRERVEARPETQHASVDRGKVSVKDSDSVNRTERN
jgi:hypothetical protein